MMIKILSEQELKFINDYIEEQNFSKEEVKREVRDLFTVMVGYGMKRDIAINNIRPVINALKNEYEK